VSKVVEGRSLLVTGDKDLLVKERYKGTAIRNAMTFTDGCLK